MQICRIRGCAILKQFMFFITLIQNVCFLIPTTLSGFFFRAKIGLPNFGIGLNPPSIPLYFDYI